MHYSIYLFIRICTNKIHINTLNKKLQLNFHHNEISKNHVPIFHPKQNLLNFFFQNKFKGLTTTLYNTFFLNKNILFVDYVCNYNYLPIENNDLFSRSYKNIHKIIKFFNISVIVYLNLNKKNYSFKKLHNTKLVNVSLSISNISKKFDINLDLPNNLITQYLVHLYVLSIYLKVKNNNLNINVSTLFLF